MAFGSVLGQLFTVDGAFKVSSRQQDYDFYNARARIRYSVELYTSRRGYYAGGKSYFASADIARNSFGKSERQ